MMNENLVNDIIQRWQETPEEDLTPDDFQQVKNFASACLTEGNSEQLLKFIQDEKNQFVGFVLMEPLLNEVVKKEKSFEHCQAALKHLTGTCRPEKLLQSLLALVEDIHPGAISETITAVIPHLQTVLHRLDDRKAACLGLALSALQNQLSRLPVPYTQQQVDADQYGLSRCCTALVGFTRSFVDEVEWKDGNCVTTAKDEELKTELFKFCMRSLREPLLEAELNRHEKSSLLLFATEIMVILPSIQQPLSELLFFSSQKKNPHMNDYQFEESRACLAYLLFVQLITIESFPAVFNPVFVLQRNMKYINHLLSSKKETHLIKGLALYKKSLEGVLDNSLTLGLLELKSFYSVQQNLRQVLTDCPMQHLRQSGLLVFQLTINKLDVEAKHKFFRCMLKTSNHAGVESYIVKNIKNQIEFSMKMGNTNKWFVGVEFLSLLELVLCLPHGVETDLLSSMDRIMESLNLLRYLLVREKETGMWEKMCKMKDDYLQILRVCISMSRAYYSAELKALKEDQKLKAKEARIATRSTTLVKSTSEKQKVPNMSPEVQNQVLQSALVTFDLMESLIFRIEEITEEKRKMPN